MAVKQNNSEQQPDVAPITASSSGAATNSANASQTTAPGSTHISDKGGGGSKSTESDSSNDVSIQPGSSDELNVGKSPGPRVERTTDEESIERLLTILQSINPEDQQSALLIYQHVIHSLATIHPGNTAEELTRSKEQITMIGQYLAMPKKDFYLMFYLRTVYNVIIRSSYQTPSCALAIVFHLFSPDLIIVAVQSLLNLEVEDDNIRKTVGLLCNWIKVCNFCKNLNLWIMALLQGLHEQKKYLLLDTISLDNIQVLFTLMVLPAVRPKVAPIVFQMLSTIYQSPEIFHKILPRIPVILQCMKEQPNAFDASLNNIQKLVDLINALMIRFDDDELYAPLKSDLLRFRPSQNCVALARALLGNAMQQTARVGLVNLGNTCYMNSVLQALAMTNDFVRNILMVETESMLFLKVQQQLALMHHSLRCELMPTRVLKATRPPGFMPGVQQDSSEFLGYLLNLLHEHEINSGLHNLQDLDDTKMPLAKGKRENGDESTLSTEEIMATGIIPYNSNDHVHNTRPHPPAISQSTTPTSMVTAQVSKKKQISTIDKTFAGKLSTTYKCLNCAWESRNEDSFRELQLSFPERDSNTYTVQDLIDYFCSPEKLDGDNQYFCERCKKLCDAERRIAFTQAPSNLILTLKQFKYDQKFHYRTKLTHKVFHDESVIVKVCAPDTLQETYIVHYDLYAGVVHAGCTVDSGHYMTYAADESKTWFKFNDSEVTNAKLEDIHNLASPNTPYILFYQMCGRSLANAPMHPMVSIPLLPPLTLDELPRSLRDYVKQDNRAYSEELMMQGFKGNNVSGNGTITRDGYQDDDEDDEMQPTGGCGGNNMGINYNRFVY